ncbi:heterokaryon incompatibility protein-domain-containing protein [Aspergillus parasiticus]|uniref:Heterokaryon incompatibility protein-domain-containing protein n=1 Tax=Aspergillus parasiticus TaxID=5067 RepID=A0A5N6DF68_ASPPA|nr:heterokaryon incompatibility protein-domain-containing protein [Aspergillus parasiticus]
MDLPRYRYEPLSGPSDIRVIELGRNKERIDAYISHVSISNSIFQALSYTWGSQEQANEAIILDKHGSSVGSIPLTKNLSDALSNLRDAKELKSKVFWIDQICINQQDEKEKSHQVAMMKEIYSCARRVITYLGPAAVPKEKQGIRLLKKIYNHFSEITRHLELVQEKTYHEQTISKRYINQGKEITALRGHRLVDWNSIMTTPILFATGHLPWAYREAGRKDSGEERLSWSTVERIQYSTWWERYSRLHPGIRHTRSSLFHNLQWYRHLLCGDPRDKVYTILSIFNDAEVLGLSPNYSPLNTVDMLSKQLSVSVLKHAVSLNLLSFALSWRQLSSTLFSWCVSFAHAENITPQHIMDSNVYIPYPRGGSLRLSHFHMGDSILVLKGRILDYVSTSTSSVAWPCHETSATSQIGFLATRAPGSPPPHDLVDASEMLSFHLWAYLRHRLHELLEWTKGSPNVNKEMLEDYNRIIKRAEALALDIDYSLLQSIEDVAEEEWEALKRMLPYVLERERRLGLTRAERMYNASDTVQDGDAILALQGADRLFVIRLCGEDTYSLIGDIFVHGLMYGEAYENQDSSEVDYDIKPV